jgi:hypothetical protein
MRGSRVEWCGRCKQAGPGPMLPSLSSPHKQGYDLTCALHQPSHGLSLYATKLQVIKGPNEGSRGSHLKKVEGSNEGSVVDGMVQRFPSIAKPRRRSGLAGHLCQVGQHLLLLELVLLVAELAADLDLALGRHDVPHFGLSEGRDRSHHSLLQGLGLTGPVRWRDGRRVRRRPQTSQDPTEQAAETRESSNTHSTGLSPKRWTRWSATGAFLYPFLLPSPRASSLVRDALGRQPIVEHVGDAGQRCQVLLKDLQSLLGAEGQDLRAADSFQGPV